MILNKGLHRKIFTAVIQSNIRLQHPVKIIFAYVCISYIGFRKLNFFAYSRNLLFLVTKFF